jgi:hypothetical protein
MPWYQVIRRLVGTALPAGGHVPNDSFGYGIFRLSQAVNATAYPVPAGTPNPVYAKYRAWLATPQGRAVARRLAAPSASAAPSPPARGGSAALPLAAAMGLLAAAGAGTAAVIARGRRRPVPRRPAQPGPALRARSAMEPASRRVTSSDRTSLVRGCLPGRRCRWFSRGGCGWPS